MKFWKIIIECIIHIYIYIFFFWYLELKESYKFLLETLLKDYGKNRKEKTDRLVKKGMSNQRNNYLII